MIENENPYQGLKPFEPDQESGQHKRNQRFFGRDIEIKNLVNLLLINRCVIFHSPSGAGKSSLINRGVIPELKARIEIEVISPVIRVNENLNALKDAMTAAKRKLTDEQQAQEHLIFNEKEHNRFVWSTLCSLDAYCAESEGKSELELTQRWIEASKLNNEADSKTGVKLKGLTLVDYFNQTPCLNGNKKPKLLIFDQFEELLTKQWRDVYSKEVFFKQLGMLLRHTSCRVLFVIREDYVAQLQRYYRYLPTSEPVEYRMELFDKESIKIAIAGPAESCNVVYSNDALNELTDKLRIYSRYDLVSDGENEVQTHKRHFGRWVNPLLMQIVCRDLWEEKRSSFEEIKGNEGGEKWWQINECHVSDLKHFNNNDLGQVLEDYYNQCLQKYFKEQDTGTELSKLQKFRQLCARRWIERHLIYKKRKIRRHIDLAAEDLGEEIKCLVEHLKKMHIVREIRPGSDTKKCLVGSNTFELVHDRLMDPIIEDNQKWVAANFGVIFVSYVGQMDERNQSYKIEEFEPAWLKSAIEDGDKSIEEYLRKEIKKVKDGLELIKEIQKNTND